MATVNLKDFNSMLKSARGVSPEALAIKLQSNGHTLGVGLEKYKLDSAKPTTLTVGQQKQIESNPFNPFSPENQKPQRPLSEIPLAASQTLPVIGGTIGSILGATRGEKGARIGAGIGAGIGQIGTDAMERLYGKEQTPSEMLTSPAKAAAIGYASEFAGQKILQGAKWLASPFLSSYNDEIATLAAKKGVKLPVSAMTNSNAATITETAASKGITGAGVEKIVEDANKKVISLADDVVKNIGGMDDPLQAGKSIIQGAEETKTIWQNTKNMLYKMADEMMKARPKTEYVNLENTKSVIDEILGKKADAIRLLGNEVNVQRLATLRKNLEKKVSISSVNSALDEIGNMIRGSGLVKVGDEGALSKVMATMAGDLDNYISLVDENLGAALSQADEFYKNGIQLLESNSGERIASLMDSPEKIVDAIVKPNAQSDVTRLLKLIGNGEGGADRIANVRATFARKIINEAIDPKYGNLVGTKLTNTMNKLGGTIDALFDKETAQSLREVAKIAIAMDKSQIVSRGSQTAFTGKLTALFSALGSGHFKTAAGIAASDAVLSKVFTSDIGRTWLTKGLSEFVPEAIRSGAGTAVRVGAQTLGSEIKKGTDSQ